MEEKERKSDINEDTSPTATDSTEEPRGSPAKRAGSGFAGIARMVGTKAKGQEGTAVDSKRQKNCEDDLPLGIEADNLNHQSQRQDSQELLDKHQGILGWQSFSSDVSNHTSNSSASLELLLNERLVDPEEMLLSLGFGIQTETYVPSLARIPERFLHQPSKATGIGLPGVVNEAEVAEEVEAIPEVAPPASTEAAPVPAAPRKRPGISTLVKTLSLMRMKSTLGRTGHMSPCRTPPQANQPTSILLPINQRYLASRGYYRQQGWPKGTFEEADEGADKENKEKVDAASRRKHFQKMKTNRQWSFGGSDEKIEENPLKDGEWRSQSLDDSNERNSSLQTCCSTNTESSTDSLDTPNIETERAFEEIRRQYNDSLARKQSSTDDLFLPRRSTNGQLSGEDQGSKLDLLHTNDIRSNNYFISPASSRQATVEKAPTISDRLPNGASIDLEDDRLNSKDGNNNKRLNSDEGAGGHAQFTGGSSDVHIIVSISDGLTSQSPPGHSDIYKKPSGRLSVKAVQRTSSDSGSTSSSGTAIGSSSIGTTTDDLDTVKNAESDLDSLSRATSPYSFSKTHVKSSNSSSCQTLEVDFRLAASLASRSKKVDSDVPTVKHLRGNRAFSHLEDSPRVQLSPLPSAINPVELMRRLHNSQDELSRMGSVQSDSSGFGDFDPTADYQGGHTDGDALKTSGVTRNTPSPHRSTTGEIATQTSLDSYGKLSGNSEGSQTGSDRRSRLGDGTRYVSMCYIPTLGGKTQEVSSASLKHRAVRSDHNLYSGHWSSGRSNHARELGDFTDHPSARGADSRPDHTKVSSVQHFQKNKTYDLNSSTKKNGWGQRLERSTTPVIQRKFTSNLELYTDETGLHSTGARAKATSPLRRHSDDGVLNETPISDELAQAAAVTVSSSVFIQPSVNSFGAGNSPLAGNLSRISPESGYPVSNFSPYRQNFSQQRSCDILEDDFSIGDWDVSPHRSWASGQLQDRVDSYHRLTGSMPPSSYAYSLPPLSASRTYDDFETYSSLAESSSDFSLHSYPEGHTKSDILDSRRLARLVNQPSFFKGKRLATGHYRPRRQFKDWSLLSKRKKLQEENRLLQYALQKYKTELNIMETSMMIDYQTVYPDMSPEEKEELEELEYLWAEVRDQVLEMEQLLVARVKSVQGGNDFHSLMSSMGIINRMIEVIKEQMYLQQVSGARSVGIREEEVIDNDSMYPEHSPDGSQGISVTGGYGNRPAARPQHTSSLSNLPSDLNVSLEQIKSSLLSQVQKEIKESTKKLELDLQEKDKEIQELKEKLSQSSETPLRPLRRWTPKPSRSRSFTSGSSQATPRPKSLTSTPMSSGVTRSRTRLLEDRLMHETDV